jgi:hypothetical protein
VVKVNGAPAGQHPPHALDEDLPFAGGTAIAEWPEVFTEQFRLWIEEGAPRPLPLRIEYQPKSFLRLTFEAVG